MRLGDYVDRSLILNELSASTKEEVLAELVRAIVARHPAVDGASALHVLRERERLGSTGIGEGIAIPHGKMGGLDDIIVAVARSTGGVDFEALDGRPCHLLFLVLAPEKVAGVHLRILAHISRLLKDPAFRKAFMEAPDSETLHTFLATT